MDVIRHKYIFLSISGALVLVSIGALTMWGLRPGIDFTGGSLLEIAFEGKRPPTEDIRQALLPLDLGHVLIQSSGERSMILRFRPVDEETHQQILARLDRVVFTKVNPTIVGDALVERRFDVIGPTIGQELKRRAILALGIAVIAIVFYIAWAFRRVSEPVSSWKYGIVAVAALIHDVLIPTGIFAVLGRFRGVEIDSLFITSLLTILGFSVHDTIVVFDRIRENLRKVSGRERFADTVNRSINETFSRSITTSLTVLLVLGALLFFGGGTTQFFALALVLGIFFGTYSSIFVASPLLVVWHSLTARR